MTEVSIVSSVPAPAIVATHVNVHYRSEGSLREMTVAARRPTHFENIVLALVQEALPKIKSPGVDITSARQLFRLAYHVGRSVGLSVLPPRRFSVPVLDTRDLEPNNMAHLLVNIVPYCLYARRVLGEDVLFLFRRLGKQFSALLEQFGIHPIYEPRRGSARVVKIRGTRGLAVYDLQETFDCFGIEFFPTIYSGMAFERRGPDKLFLARRGARALQNQSEIEALVSSHGYSTVYMEDYSIHDQLCIGAHAKHVIAIHGAAMAFLAFSAHMESVIEVMPPNVYNQLFPVCLAPRVRRYDQIIPNYDYRVVHAGWKAIVAEKSRSFSLDPSLLSGVLSRMPDDGHH